MSTPTLSTDPTRSDRDGARRWPERTMTGAHRDQRDGATSDTTPRLRATKGLPFHRLVLIEIRKAVDTRAGLWLLLALCAVVVLTCSALAIWGSQADRSTTSYLGLSIMPMTLLLPVLGIMSATQEWSQRTGLTTFTLEPRRGRVVLAKVIGAALLGLVIVASAFATSALMAAITGGSLSLASVSVPGIVLMLTVFVLQGVAFGFALLNTPLAIVGALVLPTVWTILTSAFASMAKIAVWLDLNQVTGPLVDGKMTGEHWAHLATGVGFWVALPLAIGTWRVLTREVK